MAGASDIPSTMSAWTHTLRGPPARVLHLMGDIPVRRPKKSSELLVKVSHAALNPGGSIMMHFAPFFFRHTPAVPELDFSGTIVEIGLPDQDAASETSGLLDEAQSRGVVLGAQVFGSVLVPDHVGGGHGTLAEYVIVDAANVVKKPRNIKMDAASGLAVAGSTALVLTDQARLEQGMRVLVNGASGGIGTMVVQLVKEIVGKTGTVVAVCSGRNVDMVRQLGADEVVDYQAHAPVTEYLTEQYGDAKFDVIIDAIGIQDIWTHSASYLKEDGPFVNVGVALKNYTLPSMLHTLWLMMFKNTLQPVWLGGVPRKYVRVTGLVTPQLLRELGKLVEEGKLKVPIDSCWEMQDAQKAYRKLLSGRSRGKVVVKIEED